MYISKQQHILNCKVILHTAETESSDKPDDDSDDEPNINDGESEDEDGSSNGEAGPGVGNNMCMWAAPISDNDDPFFVSFLDDDNECLLMMKPTTSSNNLNKQRQSQTVPKENKVLKYVESYTPPPCQMNLFNSSHI